MPPHPAMPRLTAGLLIALAGVDGPVAAAAGTYGLAERHAGSSFFDKWNFYISADVAECPVNYVNRAAAQKLITYPSSKQGNTQARWEVERGAKPNLQNWGGFNRDTVRVQSQSRYNVGPASKTRSVLIMIDVAHVPSGPGVWPAFWTVYTGAGGFPTEPVWPVRGEIDIIEGFGVDGQVLSTLHTTGPTWSNVAANKAFVSNETRKRCTMESYYNRSDFSGRPIGINKNCDVATNENAGCSIQGPNSSFGPPLNQQGGGVFAMEWSVQGPQQPHIAMWFWPRGGSTKLPTVEDSLTGPDRSSWQKPYALFPLSPDNCDPTHFMQQSLVFDTALCGRNMGARFVKACQEIGKPGCDLDDPAISPRPYFNFPHSASNYTGPVPTDPEGLASWQKIQCNLFVALHPEALKEAYWLVNAVNIYTDPAPELDNFQAACSMIGLGPTVSILGLPGGTACEDAFIALLCLIALCCCICCCRRRRLWSEKPATLHAYIRANEQGQPQSSITGARAAPPSADNKLCHGGFGSPTPRTGAPSPVMVDSRLSLQ